jgi:hypothetical protein
MDRTILISILALVRACHGCYIGIVFAVFLLTSAQAAETTALYSLDEGFARGAVTARMELFNKTDQQHVLSVIGDINPGVILGTNVTIWGVIRQMDLESAGHLATELRQKLPHTLLASGVNESISLTKYPPQTLECGGSIGRRTFAPADITDPHLRPLGDTAWIDMAAQGAHDYYLCIGTILIDQGFTILGFPEHENLIAHASDKPKAIGNLVDVFRTLRRYATSKGKQIYFLGDPATDETVSDIDIYYMPARFFHTSFAQEYQNKIIRPHVGVGYSYSLSPKRVGDAMTAAPRGKHVVFYVDNWDSKQDDLRRFMELDGNNRRYLLTTSLQTARRGGAYFSFNLLHCAGCLAPDVVGDKCEVRSDGKTEYDAVNCGDIPTIKQAIQAQQAVKR